jgi:O-antigen ligase/tetratricopeptide (TPR) repeat protein
MKIIKDILKYAVLVGLFAVPFIAFIVPNAMFFPFISGKGFTFRILVEIVFGLFTILAFMDKDYRPRLSWITKSVLFFALAILVSDLLGVSVYKSLWSNYERMEGFVLVAHLVLYYIVMSSMFLTRTRWNQFFNTTLLASIIMSFYGTLQLMGKIVINQGGVRVDATFGNSAYLAIYLVLHIFLSLYMLVSQAKEKWQKWVYGLIIVFETIILYYTATRGAILGLIGGMFLTGLIIFLTEKENKALRKYSMYIVGAIIILVIGFISLRGTTFVKNSPVLSRFSTLGKTELQSQGRYFVWPMAVKGFIERPIFGWGQENFNFVFNKYYDPRMYNQEQWFDRTHNLFLDWLIAGGIVGFIAYFSMYVALLYLVWRKRSVLSTGEKSVLTGMIAAYVFHNIFVFDNLISYIFFFAILAYIHSIGIDRALNGKFQTKDFSNDVINYIVIPAVTIVTLVVVYFVNVPALLANQTLIKAITPQGGDVAKNLELLKQVYAYNSFGSTEATEQLVQITSEIYGSQIPNSLKQEFYNLTKTKVEEKVKQTPHDARYLVFAGSFFNRFGQYDEAIKYLNAALVESPKKQPIYFELGSAYLSKKDFAKASELFKQAYDLEPNSMESKIIYTVGAIYTKNSAVLKEMATKLDQSVIISDNRFLQAYTAISDYNNVIAILNARLEKDPKNLQYKFSLASAYATIGQKDKAVSLIREMIAQDPSLKEEGEGYIKQIQNS